MKIPVSINDLISILESEEVAWKGYDFGDDVCKYQGRQAIKFGAMFMLLGLELSTDKPILTTDQAETVFFSMLRKMEERSHPDASGTDGFCIETFRNNWKVRFHYRNLRKRFGLPGNVIDVCE